MKKLFENWRKHLSEAAVPHSAHHVVKKMMKTGQSAKETLKSLTTDLSDEEAERWLERHKDEMDSAKQDLDEAAYEPGRAVADIDTGEDYVEPQMAEKEAMEDLADRFNVQVMFAKTTDGKHIAVATFEDGETMGYMNEEEMYQDLAKRHETA